MAIVKCMNPECDYFERAVPEGDCCPYCGEPLNPETTSPQVTPPYYTPPEPEPIPISPIPPSNAPGRTFVEPINKLIKSSLKLVHTYSGQTFTIDYDDAVNKMYLGRQDGIKSDRPIIDLSHLAFAERVSRFHAYLTWDSNRNSFTIVDDNSTNGTILNGKTLTPQQPYPLKTGDRLEFGREHKIMFEIEIT
ncbi:MAG: FHA domain-containing protein [Xenococcaceae cyanobacterium MO_207.B15]|nr:FHA domain-containing protein [Xenococcaceae cyanobacterium MO_207.B15]